MQPRAQMSCFSPIGKFEYKSTISGVLYMGVVFLVISSSTRARRWALQL